MSRKKQQDPTAVTRNPYWAARVRHHLRKGRDAADIVVRENIPSSVVTQLIKEINEHQS